MDMHFAPKQATNLTNKQIQTDPQKAPMKDLL